ncbi:MAG: DUF2779 domain-containing protein [archaeon]
MLSKSNYLIGLQCLRLLWTYKNDKESMPEHSEETLFRFDQGKEVGELAKKLFPKGIDIEDKDFKYNLKKTQEFLDKNVPLFEPSFLVEDLYARADILVPTGKKWDIIEVKSSSSVKDVNTHDLAFQRYVYEKAGLKIRKCFLMHLNKDYRLKGKVSVRNLFKIDDITDEVKNNSILIPENVERMQDILEGKMPKVDIGKQCKKPYACNLINECWAFLPEDSVMELYNSRKKFELLDSGVLLMKDIPKTFELNDKQEIQVKGKVHVDKKKISNWLGGLKEPIYYMDFETFMTAIPMYQGCKPYQQICFQYSLHVKGKHYEYLSKGLRDPRKMFLNSLLKRLGDKGSIVVYNKSFEINRLKELGSYYDVDVSSVVDRIVDLMDVFRGFYYYDPKQKGGCGLKAVLPCFGLDYSDLEIQGGSVASLEFFRGFNDENVRESLLEYCKRDTYAEVVIVEKLREMVE